MSELEVKRKVRVDTAIIAYMTPDFDGEVDGEGRIIDAGTRGACFTKPQECVAHRGTEWIEMRKGKPEVN